MHSWGNPLFTPKKAVVCTGDLLPVNLSRHPLQLIFSVVGVALGVAAVFSIDLANDSARRAFRISAQTVAGKATHQIVGGPSGLEESLYTTLRRHGGVRTIAPIVDGYALAPGRPGLTLHILGMVTRSIGDLYFALSVREVSLTAATFLKAVGLGIFGAVAASLWPAHEATSTPTRDVMRRSAIETGVRKILPAVSAAGAGSNGLTPNTTPDRSAGTISWTRTAISLPVGISPNSFR